MKQHADAPDLTQVLSSIDNSLKEHRTGSRFVNDHTRPDLIDRVARGGSHSEDDETGKTYTVAPGYASSNTGVAFLQDVVAARKGNPDAFRRLAGGKGWVEGTPTSGGFLVSPEQLPGYIEVRRASSPLRERCTNFEVDTDEVWIVTEGNTITVQHVAEAATKPDSTGSVAQKISTIHKVAGTTHLSDELLSDSHGMAALLVERQFGKQIGIAIDTAIIGGTGTGQPTGIRNAAGVTASAIDGQSGRELHNSVLKALSRLDQKFYPADTVVVHPRDVVKWALATNAQNDYLFPGGLASALPRGVGLVVDPNLPATLGAGTNESVIIVGAFRQGGYFFQRQPLTIEASQHAAFVSDETVVRGLERYGFCVAVPAAFEILNAIAP